MSSIVTFDFSAATYSEPLRVLLLSVSFFVMSSVVRRRPWTTAAFQSVRRLAGMARVALSNSEPSTSGNFAS